MLVHAKSYAQSPAVPKAVFKVFRECCILAFSILLIARFLSGAELPAGTLLEVRLSSATGSRISHRGDPIEATVIAPVSAHGQVLIQQGSRVLGVISEATALGFGIRHRTASLSYSFRSLQLSSGSIIPVETKLLEVETAKEGVDGLGVVRGIHPIASLSSGVSLCALSWMLLNPAVGIPVWATKSLIAPTANPEINFAPGTELILQITSAVALPETGVDLVTATAFGQDDLAQIEHSLRGSEQRSFMGHRPSDFVNLLIIGSRDQVSRAFRASGWAKSQRKSPLSLYRLYHAITNRHGYPSAPMNTLTLNGMPAALAQQKSLDTIQRRHHVRLWEHPSEKNLWLATAAEDVGLRFNETHWTHSTDPEIDHERAKVVDDLTFTGCVDAAGLVSRSGVDFRQDSKPGHKTASDGFVAAIRLNDCTHPRLMAGSRGSSVVQNRRLLNSLVALRDDLVRSSIFFTMYNALNCLAKNKLEPKIVRAPFSGGVRRGLDWLAVTRPPNVARPVSTELAGQ